LAEEGMPIMRIRFSRSVKAARDFEINALYSIKRTIFGALGKEGDFEKIISNGRISSQFLSEGNSISDLSVFFRFDLVGGSGSTCYFFLAMRNESLSGYVFGLDFESSEAGFVELSPSKFSLYKAITIKDREYKAIYEYSENIVGYDEVPWEP
jgi:hypothetical protein